MPTSSTALAPRKSVARSRVSNGSAIFLEAIDGRSRNARRFRDVLAEIASDLGGAACLSEGQRQLARRCALLAVECERIEARAISGGRIDLDEYGKLVDRIGRAFVRLGIRRKQRDVTPDLRSYLKQRSDDGGLA